MSYVLPYLIGLSMGLRKLGKFLAGQWPVLVFSFGIIIAMIYVSSRQHTAITTSQIATSERGTMLTVPQSIKYQSLPIEQTIEKECYKNGQIPTKVVYNMIDFAKEIRVNSRAADIGLGLTLIKLATAREVMQNPAMTAEQLKTDTLMNVTASIRYLSRMISQFNGDLKYGILAYYKGPGTLQKDIRNNTVSYRLADRMLADRVATVKKLSTYVAKTAKKPSVLAKVPPVMHYDEIQMPEPELPAPPEVMTAMTPLTPAFLILNADSISINSKLDTITLNPIKVKVDSIRRDVDSITTSTIVY